MSNRKIILASASPRRIALLHQIGIDAEVMPSQKPENVTLDEPAAVVRALSRQKAEDIAQAVRAARQGRTGIGKNPGACFQTGKGIIEEGLANTSGTSDGSVPQENDDSDDLDAIIIGADTVVAIDGKILGKPATHEAAYEMIRELAGRAHHVFTGVTVCCGRQEETFVETTTVHVVSMTQEEIRAYADSDEPMDKAGAYGIQGLFGRYILGIEGDYNNVVGLPVAHLYQVLKRYL